MAKQHPILPFDIVAIGAHPDDVELFSGGTLALLASRGFRIAVVHLTRGECGTRGTPKTRERESAEAARILGVAKRLTLNLGDCRLADSDANRRAVVGVLRKLRPVVVMTHGVESRHPDHSATHALVRASCFLSNVGGYKAAGERHRVSELIHFVGHEEGDAARPDWIVDVTERHEAKLRALRAYATQFYSPKTANKGPKTLLSSPEFWEAIETRAKRCGQAIGARYGEPFVFQHPPHANHAFVKMIRGN